MNVEDAIRILTGAGFTVTLVAPATSVTQQAAPVVAPPVTAPAAPEAPVVAPQAPVVAPQAPVVAPPVLNFGKVSL